MITYLKGDATEPVGDCTKIIAHVCNDIGGWGRGFVLAISRRWLQPELMYRTWSKKDDGTFLLGTVQFVKVRTDLTVANMVAQRDTKPSDDGTPPIRYDVLRTCLKQVAVQAKETSSSVHMPRIGCGLAGGSWDLVEPIIKDELDGVEVFVYDL